MLMNTLIQSILYPKIGFSLSFIIGTGASFVCKYFWDYFFVFKLKISSYIISSIAATFLSVLLECLLIRFLGITPAAIIGLFLGYNFKFFSDGFGLFDGGN